MAVSLDALGTTLITTTPETFEQLAAAAGLTLGQLAQAVDCDPEIFRRVAQARQPLAADLAERIAAALGVGVGVVQGVAKYVTPLRGLALSKPGPSDVARGDDFPTVPLAHTAPPAVIGSTVPQRVAFVVGAGLGVTSADGVQRLGRNTGRIHQRTTLAATSPGPAVYDASLRAVWVFGTGGAARFSVATGALELEVADGSYGTPSSAVYDAVHARVWVAGSTGLARIDSTTGLTDLLVTLTIGPRVYVPRDLTAVAGKVYVTGYYLTGISPPVSGRVFEVDASGAVLRVSTGIDLESAWGIAYDGSTYLWGTSCSLDPVGSTARIWRVPVGSMIAAVETITGSPAIVDPTWIGRAFGSWWVSDLQHAGPRLMRISDLGVIEGQRSFDVTGGTGGRIAQAIDGDADPWFIWYADRGVGLVHVMTPGDLEGPELVFDTGGNPDGLVLPPLV